MFGIFQHNNHVSAMQGLTLKSLRHHVALQPLFVIMGVGITFVSLYIGRWGNSPSKIYVLSHFLFLASPPDWPPKLLTWTGLKTRWRISTDTTKTGERQLDCVGLLSQTDDLSGNSSGSTPGELITAISLTREGLPTTKTEGPELFSQ